MTISGIGTSVSECCNGTCLWVYPRQDGKLIGVISHVPALKERFSIQIQVMPQTGGRSQISWPGCGSLIAQEQAVAVG